MSTKRLFFITIVAVLVAVAAVSVRQVITTKAAGQADRSYDLLEAARGHKGIKADHSYDQIESARTGPGLKADRSYDQIESVRTAPAANLFYGPIEAIRNNRSFDSTKPLSLSCPDGECPFQLSNGRWVR